jgi:hypothetical protein
VKATLFLAAAPATVSLAAGATRTVCTITINSADEKQALQGAPAAGSYKFVELVQRGRQDWLRSPASRASNATSSSSPATSMPAILLLGPHRQSDHFAIDELERAACSDSCPGSSRA